MRKHAASQQEHLITLAVSLLQGQQRKKTADKHKCQTKQQPINVVPLSWATGKTNQEINTQKCQTKQEQADFS